MKRTMKEILQGLKEYNDTHERSLTYGKYVLMLERQDKSIQKQKNAERKGVRAGDDKSGKETNIKMLRPTRPKNK